MSLASDLLPALDEIRAIPGDLGLRPFTVTVKVTTWSGARVGLGTGTTTSTLLTTARGTGRVKVESLSDEAIVASGGLYTKEDLRVGPMTPDFSGGGVSTDTLDPATSASPTEIRYLVTGPGLSTDGELYERVGSEFDSSLHRYIVIRKTGRQP